MAPTPLAMAQVRPATAATHSAWPVTLPKKATVRLKQGGSLTGRLVRLTPSAFTLAVGAQTRTVAMTQVSTIEFAKLEDLWITLPNGGRQRARPPRGLSLPIEAVPSSAVQVNAVTDTATFDLTQVLSEAQFAKLNKDPGVLFVLNRIEMSADGTLTLRVRPYRVD